MEAFYSEGERVRTGPRIEALYAGIASKKLLRKKLIALSQLIAGATGIFIGVEVLMSTFIASSKLFAAFLLATGSLVISRSENIFKKGVGTLTNSKKGSRGKR